MIELNSYINIARYKIRIERPFHLNLKIHLITMLISHFTPRARPPAGDKSFRDE